MAAIPSFAEERGHVRALGGATFGAEVAPVFGGGAGFRIADGLSVTVELGQMQDITSEDQHDVVEAAEDLANRLLPIDVELDLEMKAFYGLAGVRYDFTRGNRVRPYVEASGGFASVSVDLNASFAGFDLPDVIDDEVGLEEETNAMLAVGGGLALDFNDTVGLDLAYRYNRIFTSGDGTSVNQAYGALRFTF